jgi:hypothetical protein
MCEYSLAGIPNRLAVEGEELIVHRFCTGSRGLASPADLPSPRRRRSGWSIWDDVRAGRSMFQASPPAVCIAPGTRLLLQDIPERLQQPLGLNAVEKVTFTQLTAEAYQFRDAVRFKNGKELLLQHLSGGQHVTVLALPTDESTPERDVPASESALIG